MSTTHAVVGSSSLLYYRTVLDVVQLAATSTANVTFARFATASIANGMLTWAVASKMPLLTNIMSETTEIKGVQSNVMTGPANIVFRRFRTLWTGIDEVLEML